MVFSSITFLTVFLPVVFILHTLIRDIRFRNALLLAASLLFYAYGEPVYIILLLVCAMTNYAFARLIGEGSVGARTAEISSDVNVQGGSREAEQGKKLSIEQGEDQRADQSGKQDTERREKQKADQDEERSTRQGQKQKAIQDKKPDAEQPEAGERLRRRAFLILAVAVNIGLLIFFKYASFLVGLLNSVAHLSFPVPDIRLPIGISFYTFQALSYVIDVYRGQVRAQSSFPKVLLYICFFPQLIAGPIVKYHDVERELTRRTVTLDGVHAGVRRFIIGLSKKVLIANTMAVCADALFARDAVGLGTAGTWIGAVSYLMQIYFDFSGYSDMAIGMGLLFGFHFKENFRLPYTSASVTEFWRRWHISLSGWFREYLYIPLGGNRKGKARTILNKWIVFAFTGLWHGANLTFLLWGLYHGFFLMLEEVIPGRERHQKQRQDKCYADGRASVSNALRNSKVDDQNNQHDRNAGLCPDMPSPSRHKKIKVKNGGLRYIFLHIYTVLVVLIGFVIFRADTITEGLRWIEGMFMPATASPAGWALVLHNLTPLFLFTALAGLVWSGILTPRLGRKLLERTLASDTRPSKESMRVSDMILDILSLLLLVLCMLSLAGGTYNPFIYFRF